MLVLDANILIRAVLGSRVLFLLRKYGEHVRFLAPDTAFQEARYSLPEILERVRFQSLRRWPPWASWLSWCRQSKAKPTRLLKISPAGEYPNATRTIGPSSHGARARLPNLDGRHRLLRMRRGDLDFGPGRVVPGGCLGGRSMTDQGSGLLMSE